MATNEFLKASLEHFKQQKQRILNDLRAVETTIRQIQTELGETPDSQSDFAAMALVPEPTKVQVPSKTSIYTPRPDEFFSLSQGEAAKLFLGKIGCAISIDDLVSGLKAGGCKVGGVDPKKTLYVSLTGNARDFVAIGNGFIGLRSFYPSMPKLGRPKNGNKQKSKKGGRKKSAKPNHGKAKKAKQDKSPHIKMPPPPARDEPAPTQAKNTGDVKVAIRDVLRDHVARTPDDVLRAVQHKLGYPVKKIAIYGVLRKKEFEQVEGKYRLRPATDESVVLQ